MAARLKSADSTAVMARRAPSEVATDDTQTALYRTLDYFPTPPWAARAGAEVLRSLDPSCRVVREPACGGMHMAGALAEYFHEVIPTDVHSHGPDTPIRDWLDDAAWPQEPDCDWFVTNPPFSLARDFVTRGLVRSRRGVALLLRIAVLEGVDRHGILAGSEARLTLLAPFSERVPMTLGKWDPKSSTATAYAWFFWSKHHEPAAPQWIGPGTRQRLTRPDDAARYGFSGPSAFLDLMAGEAA